MRCWVVVLVPNDPNGLGEWLNGPINGAFFMSSGGPDLAGFTLAAAEF